MNTETNDPRNGPKDRKERGGEQIGNMSEADVTPRREGGDDALGEIMPNDNRADEKVIVNEQRENKAVNIPSQTAVNTSEQTGNDEEVI